MGWEYGVTVNEQDNGQSAEDTARQLLDVWYERLIHNVGQQYRLEKDEAGFAVWNDKEAKWPEVLEVQLQLPDREAQSATDTPGQVELYILFHIGGKQAADMLEVMDSTLAEYAPDAERLEY
ncbi:hypothetical protein [Paenibacillus kandeliae]|uniref:hypothetical protein n=1 Tax=Paenibacillus kandeliae TaxID=3231269 RepID=UPI0034577873